MVGVGGKTTKNCNDAENSVLKFSFLVTCRVMKSYLMRKSVFFNLKILALHLSSSSAAADSATSILSVMFVASVFI